MKIDINPFFESIKARLLSEANSQEAGAIESNTEYLAEFKKRAFNLADGIATEQISYAFAVKRFAEEEVNLRDHVLATASGAASDAETLAKDVVGEFEKFLRDQITAAA